jgi:hypothetical protein
VGKEFVDLNVRLSWVLLVVLSGCGGSDGRYVGTVSTEQGACGVGFDAQGKATATLMLHDGDAKFAPSGGVLVLDGHVDSTGHVLVGSSAPGADRKPFVQVFEATRDGERVVGKFATPRCRATVELSRR